MNRKKSIILIITVFMILNILGMKKEIYASENLYINENTNYKAIIEDDADLLSEAEEKELLSQIKPLTEFGNIGFKSINQNSFDNTDKYAKSYYERTFGKKSGTIFLIDMKYRKVYIYSYGQNYKRVTKSKANVITDNIYRMATKKDYYGCAKEAYTEILATLEGEKIAEPMKYICNVLIAMISAQFIIFFIINKVLKPKVATNKELISSAKSSFENSRPEIHMIHQTRIYSPIDTDSGGGRRRRRSEEAAAGGGGGRRTAEVTVSNFAKKGEKNV